MPAQALPLGVGPFSVLRLVEIPHAMLLSPNARTSANRVLLADTIRLVSVSRS